MTWLWILAGVVLLTGTLLFLRSGVELHFGEQFTLDLCVGTFRFRLVPAKKKKRRPRKRLQRKKKAKKKKPTEEAEEKPKDSERKAGRNWYRTLDIVITVLENIKRHFSRLTKIIHLKIAVHFVVGNTDAAKIAEEYGRLCAAMGNLTPLLYRLFTVQSCSVRVDADFLAERTRIKGNIQITSSLGVVLITVVPIFVSFGKDYRERRKKRAERKAIV